MLKEGFTAEEVTAAKTGYLQGRQVAGAGRRAGRTLKHLSVSRPHARVGRSFGEQIKALTPEQINAAMGRHLAVRPAHHHEGRRLQGGALSCARGSRSLTSPASLDYVPRTPARSRCRAGGTTDRVVVN